jgi:hypothetical protein
MKQDLSMASATKDVLLEILYVDRDKDKLSEFFIITGITHENSEYQFRIIKKHYDQYPIRQGTFIIASFVNKISVIQKANSQSPSTYSNWHLNYHSEISKDFYIYFKEKKMLNDIGAYNINFERIKEAYCNYLEAGMPETLIYQLIFNRKLQ